MCVYIWTLYLIPLMSICLYADTTPVTDHDSRWPTINVKTFLEKNKVGALTLPGMKTYYKAIVTKTDWHWTKIEKSVKHNREPQFITKQLKKEGTVNKWCWENQEPNGKKINLTAYAKINYRQIMLLYEKGNFQKITKE